MENLHYVSWKKPWMMGKGSPSQQAPWWAPQYVVDFGDGRCSEEEEGWPVAPGYMLTATRRIHLALSVTARQRV